MQRASQLCFYCLACLHAVPGRCFITRYGCRGIKGQDVLGLIEFQIYRCAAKPLHAVTVLKRPIIRPPGPVE